MAMLLSWARLCPAFVAAAMIIAPSAAGAQSAAPQASPSTLLVHGDRPGPVIAPEIYGQFVEHLGRGVYEGIWVGDDRSIPNTRGVRNDVVRVLREAKIPAIRWPGGCFADNYHWRDGIGPRAKRQQGINASWGNVPDRNAFGTHEFMDFMDQIGAAPFVSVNMGSGSVREADEWMRYMTAPAESAAGAERAANGHRAPWAVPFVGVGNESWGCGGNMTAETYVANFRQYAAIVRSFSSPRAKLIAVGADTDDYDWTDKLMAGAMTWRPNPTPLALVDPNPLMWGLSLHFYTFTGNDWHAKGRNVGFSQGDWAKAVARANLTEDIVTRHAAIMDRYDPEKKVALVVDEWGAWFDSEKDAPSQLYLESTTRDAVIAGLSLNIFNRHADRVRMANLAQMANVIQSLVLTRGKEMVVTPTWHVFDLYKVHQGATQVPVDVSTPDYVEGTIKVPTLSVSASRDAAGVMHMSIVNLDPTRAAPVDAVLTGVSGNAATARTVTGDQIDTRVRFGEPDPFVPRALSGISLNGDRLTLTVPPRSVTMVTLR
ncbi:MAG TPA: alpha-L-arabinofuranosidase C-terminal domain-containing protein [Sphingomonas sp.]